MRARSCFLVLGLVAAACGGLAQPQRTLRVAGAQIPVTRDVHANARALERALDYAASERADILVTPEGSLSGYHTNFDARLTAALMSIQSVKGVEVGDGFALATRPGSRAHDEILVRGGRLARRTARAGGIEGGISTGQPIRVRAAMKPFSTVPRPLATVDLATGEPATAIRQRTDVCAVPAGAVVGEAVVAFVLAEAMLEKFGGDSLPETRRNLEAYVEGLP
ncbi:MAG: chorismate synthase [Firmicutes bacterium]|nr:chorismate synthase [Bacillota bacterium]